MGVWDPAIRKIGDPLLRELAARGRIRHFAKGALIVRESEPGASLFVLLAGKARVYVSDARGRQMVLRHCEPVSYVGEMAVDGKPRTASVCAQEPSVCAEVGWDQLRAACAANPDLPMRMWLDSIGRTRATTVELKDLALMDVYGRLAGLLLGLEYVDEGGESWSRERLTQQEIAHRIGSSRDMVSKILKDLRTGGYIETRDRRFRILRRPPARW
jgi:CRP/FNR family transcriptional regulator, cyclic AMP receptor protein